MAELIDIKNEQFWEILFDEACVEGQQAERIEKELKTIATSEAEIRARVVDEFAEKMKKEAYDKEYNVWTKDTMISIWESTIDEIAEQMKGVNEDDGTESY